MYLVTGARGIVGQPLCQRLYAQQTEFMAVSRVAETQSGQSDDWKRLQWDMHDELNTAQSTALNGVQRLIHCAPLWMLKSTHLRRLKKLGLKRVVAFSSTSIEGKSATSSPKEAAVVESLKNAETEIHKACEDLDIQLTVLRPSLIYGHGRDQNISKIAQTIKRFGVMLIVGQARGLRQPVHADDLVNAALAVVERSASYGKVYNVVGGESLSYRDMVLRIFASLHAKPRIVSLPLPLMRGLLSCLSWVSSFAYTPDMADRMNQDLEYSCQEAENDFDYSARAFYPKLGQDIVLSDICDTDHNAS